MVSQLITTVTPLLPPLVQMVMEYGDIQTHMEIPEEVYKDHTRYMDSYFDRQAPTCPYILVRPLYSITISKTSTMVTDVWPNGHIQSDIVIHLLYLWARPLLYMENETLSHQIFVPQYSGIHFQTGARREDVHFRNLIHYRSGCVDHQRAINEMTNQIRLGVDLHAIKQYLPPLQRDPTHECGMHCTGSHCETQPCESETKSINDLFAPEFENQLRIPSTNRLYRMEISLYPHAIYTTNSEHSERPQYAKLARCLDFSVPDTIRCYVKFESEKQTKDDTSATDANITPSSLANSSEIRFADVLLNRKLMANVPQQSILAPHDRDNGDPLLWRFIQADLNPTFDIPRLFQNILSTTDEPTLFDVCQALFTQHIN
jgi:hypothetical protein